MIFLHMVEAVSEIVEYITGGVLVGYVIILGVINETKQVGKFVDDCIAELENNPNEILEKEIMNIKPDDEVEHELGMTINYYKKNK